MENTLIRDFEISLIDFDAKYGRRCLNVHGF